MTTHAPCGATWTGLRIAHCSTCHETFTTPANFDKHRRGGECRPPADCGLVLSERGYWAMPGRPDEDER